MALPAKDNLPTLQDDMTGDSVAMETEASSRSEDAVTVLTSSDNLPSVLHVTLLKEPGYGILSLYIIISNTFS